MTQQTINVGGAPNDGTGDTARASFQKVNAMMTEQYGTLSGTGWYVAQTVGDGVTDDTAAVNAAIAATAGTPTPIYFPPGAVGKIRITSTIVFNNPRQSIYMDSSGAGTGSGVSGATFSWHGANNIPMVVLGSSDAGNAGAFLSLEYRVNCVNFFATTGNIGIQVLGQHTLCRFYLNSTGCDTSIQLYAKRTGGGGYIAYNQFYLFALTVGSPGIANLSILEGNSGGWINQNIFYGGDFTGSGVNAGVVFARDSGGYSQTQTNIFIGPSFQGCLKPIWFNDNGQGNLFYQCRDESNGPNFMTCTDVNDVGISGNFAWLQYTDNSAETPLISSTPPTTGTAGKPFGNAVYTQDYTYDEWFSGSLVDKAFVTSSTKTVAPGPGGILSNSISVKGMSMLDDSVGGYWKEAYSSYGGHYIGMTSILCVDSHLGWFVDTTYFKDFEFIIDTGASPLGVQCWIATFDVNGNPLNGTGGFPAGGGNTTELANQYRGDTSFYTGMGGMRFRLQAAATTMRIAFGRYQTSAPISVKSLRIRAWANVPKGGNTAVGTQVGLKVYPGLLQLTDEFVTNVNPATNLGSGYTVAGQKIGDSTGASNGWVCTTSGWNPRPWVLSTVYYYDMLVQNDTGKVYVCTVGGTSAASGGPTGTGSAIVDNTVTWKWIATGIATWAPASAEVPIYAAGNTGATPAPDFSNGPEQSWTLSANTTWGVPTNGILGQTLTLLVTSNGAWTTAWNATYRNAPAWAVAANNQKATANFMYDGTNWQFTGGSLAFA